jgi:hypothetical protein
MTPFFLRLWRYSAKGTNAESYKMIFDREGAGEGTKNFSLEMVHFGAL